MHRNTETALRERVKELTCLYGIAKVAASPNTDLAEQLRAIVALLPPAWLHPDAARADLELDGTSYTAGLDAPPLATIAAEVLAGGAPRGRVLVGYCRALPGTDDGPFLREERPLIEAVAREVGLLVERREAEAERARLQEQLRHADRLATIGTLASGIAHELNEPLGNALGFAQLAIKAKGAPEAVLRDLRKIEASCLYAREVVRKLLIFARQEAPRRASLDLNQVIADALAFLRQRFADGGVEVQFLPAAALPAIEADAVHLKQVAVNLLVNALQAMPGGGTVRVRTEGAAGAVRLVVEDTGTGMSEDVRRKIFVPFFTTKDVGKGTGLGLSVVHGIVSAHGGSIEVASRPGRGSSFAVTLPLGPAARIPGEERK